MQATTNTPAFLPTRSEEPPSRHYACPDCGSEFTAQPVLWAGRDLLSERRCPECVQAAEVEREARHRDEAEQRLSAQWQRICPDLYRETDLSRLPNSLCDALESWGGKNGLGLIGDAGKGKTRAAFEALKRRHYFGKACAAISGTQLHRVLCDQASDDPVMRDAARTRCKELRQADVLLIDDLGKQKFTDASQADLFDLLETRCANRRPVIWTTNSSSKELGARLSADRGAAILRRLVEFSQIVKV